MALTMTTSSMQQTLLRGVPVALRLLQVSTALPTTTSTTTTAVFDAPQRRPFFAYFRIAFNTVDKDRLATVGPDRLCAEWLLKNGGAVTFVGGSQSVGDYNQLGPQTSKAGQPRIAAIDATDASIMAIGFEHLHGCTAIERILLRRCKHMESEALGALAAHVGGTLRELLIEECFNVTDAGLRSLGALQRLRSLTVSGVPYVKDVDAVRAELAAKLPKGCAISIRK